MESFEKALADKFRHLSIDDDILAIAERLRDQAIAEIHNNGEMCEEKQSLIKSIRVVPGDKEHEFLVVSTDDYGKDLEFGTRNSLESPWFIPAFVTVTGSIHNCLHGALKRALQKTRRLHVRR